ncbi:uncharacterized protein LOC141943699 [Strix uralensis]|uniref:uncharacterized protein LOC141943699 n=1 Tax=Strix uralensis TaxID=36305 RepID=UPI003DA72B9F
MLHRAETKAELIHYSRLSKVRSHPGLAAEFPERCDTALAGLVETGPFILHPPPDPAQILPVILPSLFATSLFSHTLDDALPFFSSLYCVATSPAAKPAWKETTHKNNKASPASKVDMQLLRRNLGSVGKKTLGEETHFQLFISSVSLTTGQDTVCGGEFNCANNAAKSYVLYCRVLFASEQSPALYLHLETVRTEIWKYFPLRSMILPGKTLFIQILSGLQSLETCLKRHRSPWSNSQNLDPKISLKSLHDVPSPLYFREDDSYMLGEVR